VNEIINATRSTIDTFRFWLDCACQPVVTLNRLLQHETDEGCWAATAKLWTVSFIIMSVSLFPILRLYGDAWNNAGFIISNLLFTMVGMALIATISHVILRVFKLKSDFNRTLVMYSTPAVTYAPIISWMNLYQTNRIFEMVATFKKQGLPIDETLGKIIKTALMNIIISSGALSEIINSCEFIISLIVLTIFAEAVSQWYCNDRFKSYSAVSLALLLSVSLILLILAPIQMFIIYAFVD
jgi:hypothetical protein